MGAQNFETASWGKTPREAFAAAVEHAQYEYGHGGGSGTIAEKRGDGYVLFELPPRLTAAKLIQWAYEFQTEDAGGYWREELGRAQRDARDAKPGTVLDARRRVKRAEKEVQAAAKRLEKFKRQVGAHYAFVERVARVADDKWGACVCVELKGAERARWAGKQPKRGLRAFLFFGMAPT